MSVVYCLSTPSGNASYVGVTNNLARRLRQHRTEVVGGAEATGARFAKKKGDPAQWQLACHLSGFKTRKHALQFEWRWQRGGVPRRHKYPATAVTYRQRLQHLRATLSLPQVTSTAPLMTDCCLTLHWHGRHWMPAYVGAGNIRRDGHVDHVLEEAPMEEREEEEEATIRV